MPDTKCSAQSLLENKTPKKEDKVPELIVFHSGNPA